MNPGAGRLGGREEFERCVLGGGIALFPADTVYGLGCDPLNPSAVARINALKGRDPHKPSAVMYFDALMMRELLADLGPRTAAAVGALLPGPVTLVLPNTAGRYPLACGEDPSRLGVRFIEGPLSGAGCAVLQTSANLSGQQEARRVEEVDRAVSDGVDLVVDAGELPGTPSTVVDLTDLDANGTHRILREGAVPAEQVATTLADTVEP